MCDIMNSMKNEYTYATKKIKLAFLSMKILALIFFALFILSYNLIFVIISLVILSAWKMYDDFSSRPSRLKRRGRGLKGKRRFVDFDKDVDLIDIEVIDVKG